MLPDSLILWAALLSGMPTAAQAGVAHETVSPAGRGDFHDLQAAIDALPAQGGTIAIEPGTYRGQFYVGKPHVRIVGRGRRPEDVVLVAGSSAATSGSIYASATAYIAGDDFTASNLTFANDWDDDPSHGASQAVALAVSGDRAAFTHVRVLGGQDTLYLTQQPGRTARQYFGDCYVAGHVDFTFGNARTFFDRCEIYGVDHDKVLYTAQSRNAPDEKGGFVFHDCTFTAGRAPGGIYLGRPWRPYARVVLLGSRVEVSLAPGGWREWKPGLTHDGGTVTYAEYRTRYAHGAPPRSRIRELTNEEAAKWSLDAFFGGDTRWIEASGQGNKDDE
jgi:pectin methylesterase-like acyl-CoA thioesterase